MTTTDEQPAAEGPLVPPPAAGPVGPDDAPPIYAGSVSAWMGLRTYVVSALLD
ncbi:MAG: hypothetical protein NTW87_36085 [Planctomycetota bacterium]|nr:hypothetical protein [Planctomycetota bacterium]